MQKCGAKCDVMSRVVGFFTPTNQWNRGKSEEFKMRKTFNINQEAAKIKEESKKSVFTKSSI